MNKATLLKFMSLYPPYLGAGIRVKKIADDFSQINVEMNLHFWNKNYVGTHFGGSLYSMVDPFYMLMLMQKLGKNFIVWDKAANIKFVKPGRGTVYANFEITDEQINNIIRELEDKPKINPIYKVEIKDDAGQIIAIVEKTLQISKKSK